MPSTPERGPEQAQLSMAATFDRRGTSRRSDASPSAPATDEWDALEDVARTLTASGWYRVVRRFQRRDRYASPTPQGVRYGLYVDVETTGLDPATDKIIELAMVRFEFDKGGVVYAVDEPVSFFEDPGVPIGGAITALTGIDDEMVRGTRIDDDRVKELLEGCVLVIAHNASFDRQFLENRLPLFGDMAWACSQREVPWRTIVNGGEKLEWLLYQVCAEFHDGHRAADDCMAGVHLLATADIEGRKAFGLLLESARREMMRVWAVGADFDAKDRMKARGYKFNAGSDGRPKAWWVDVAAPELDEEMSWLADAAYSGRKCVAQIKPITARERYSARA